MVDTVPDPSTVDAGRVPQTDHGRAPGPKAIVFEFNVPMLIDVLVELKQQYQWEPVYITTNYTRDLVDSHFPSIVYQETNDARFCWPAAEFADFGEIAVIDQPTAEALGYVEVMALRQMDRLELLGSFSLRERLLHFHRLVAYWSAVFDRLQPDVLLMITAPHVVYDYVAYALARRRGIRTILFEYVGVDQGLVMAIDQFENGLPPLMEEYRRLQANPPPQPIVLPDRMESHLRALRGSYERALPQSTRELWAASEARKIAALEAEEPAAAREACAPSQVSEPTLPPQQVIAAERTGFRARVKRAYFAFRGASPEGTKNTRPSETAADAAPPAPPSFQRPPPPPAQGYYDGRFHVLAPEDIARSAADFRRDRGEALKRRYEELAVEPDLAQPFVYVALAMQPERTTNPNGGVFDDQDLMVGMIAAALPSGWRIYVKEHPSQFVYGTWIERGRWPRFYDTLVANPEVSLVPLKSPSFDLIDHARAVATIAGTSSWEALVRGVPTLVFGEAWYKGCAGSYTVRTMEDCRRALERIAAGERPEPEAVRLLLRAVERTALVAYLSDDDKPFAQIDEATNVKRLARAIAQCYETPDVEPLVRASA
jgi:hypothetical protein